MDRRKFNKGNPNPKWVKGVSGNPKGRPKGTGKNQIFDALLDVQPNATKGEIAQELYKLAMGPDVDSKHKMMALATLVDLTFEKPKETIETTNISIDDISDLVQFKNTDDNSE